MFTDTEKVNLRRWMGYPAFGGVPVQAFGHRFYQAYGTLEFRMNNISAAEEQVVRDRYMASTKLPALEDGVLASADNMDTAAAAVWTRNPQEAAERLALYTYLRRDLCNFFGVPPGPNFSGSGGSVAMVV